MMQWLTYFRSRINVLLTHKFQKTSILVQRRIWFSSCFLRYATDFIFSERRQVKSFLKLLIFFCCLSVLSFLAIFIRFFSKESLRWRLFRFMLVFKDRAANFDFLFRALFETYTQFLFSQARNEPIKFNLLQISELYGILAIRK